MEWYLHRQRKLSSWVKPFSYDLFSELENCLFLQYSLKGSLHFKSSFWFRRRKEEAAWNNLKVLFSSLMTDQSNNRRDIVGDILTDEGLAVAIVKMHLECIIPLFAEKSENLEDPRLGRISYRSQLQEHYLKQVCFSHPEGNEDSNPQVEVNRGREPPFALVDITECSETNGISEVEHCSPVRRPDSVIPFLSPAFSLELSPTTTEKRSPYVTLPNCTGSMVERSLSYGEETHLADAQKESLVIGRLCARPSELVAELQEPSSTNSKHLHERQSNQPTNGTVLDVGHTRITQHSNGVISWHSHLDITFTSETARSFPCERDIWPGRVIPLNPVTEEKLQDPRLVPSALRGRGYGDFVLRPLDFERSQNEHITFRRELGNERTSRLSPENKRAHAVIDISCHEHSNEITGGESAENHHTDDIVSVKRESQEIGTPEKMLERESGPSQAQIEQWLAANRRLWGHSFVHSRQASPEPPNSVYSPSSVLSPLFSPDVFLSPSPVSSIRREVPVQFNCSETDVEAPPEEERGKAQAQQNGQADRPEKNRETSPLGSEPPQAINQGYLADWPPSTYWFPLQPVWPQVPSEQQSLCAASAQLSVSLAPSLGHVSSAEASKKPPSVGTWQAESLPQYPGCFSAPPQSLQSLQEQVSLSSSTPRQLPEERVFSSMPPQPQVPPSQSQPAPYNGPVPFVSPVAVPFAVPQAVPMEGAGPQVQPQSDMPMEAQAPQPQECYYGHAEMPPEAGSKFEQEGIVQEAPFCYEQMQFQSNSQVQSSLAPQCGHPSSNSQVEAQIEWEHVAQPELWQEHPYEQQYENLRDDMPEAVPEGVRYTYSPVAQEEYSNGMCCQQNSESGFPQLAQAQHSEIKACIDSHYTSLLQQEIPFSCTEMSQHAGSELDLQGSSQGYNFVHLQAHVERQFQQTPLQRAPQHEGLYTYSHTAAIPAASHTEGQPLTYSHMQLNPLSVAATPVPTSDAYLLGHSPMHCQHEWTPAVCMTDSSEPQFLQATMQTQGAVIGTFEQDPYTSSSLAAVVQWPVSSSAINCFQPCSLPQQAQCWPTQVMCPVPTVQTPLQCMTSPQLTPTCSGLIPAAQGSFWQLPATNCLGQQSSSIGMSQGATSLPASGGLPDAAVSFQLPVAPLPPLPTYPPPSKPPPPSVPPPPKSPPPVQPPPPASPPPNCQMHGRPPPPSYPPTSTPSRSPASSHSSPHQPARHEECRSRSYSSSQSPHVKYPIWPPVDTKSRSVQYQGHRHSSTRSFRSSRTAR